MSASPKRELPEDAVVAPPKRVTLLPPRRLVVQHGLDPVEFEELPTVIATTAELRPVQLIGAEELLSPERSVRLYDVTPLLVDVPARTVSGILLDLAWNNVYATRVYRKTAVREFTAMMVPRNEICLIAQSLDRLNEVIRAHNLQRNREYDAELLDDPAHAGAHVEVPKWNRESGNSFEVAAQLRRLEGVLVAEPMRFATARPAAPVAY